MSQFLDSEAEESEVSIQHDQINNLNFIISLYQLSMICDYINKYNTN